jgi:murein hydrolase activator
VIPRLALALPLLIAPGLLLAASAPVPPVADPLSVQLARATAEARAADTEAARLEKSAREARHEADRLRGRQAAAAQAIAAAEARISASDARIRILASEIAARRQRLAQQQAPAGALLAGLAMMASRPPMLAILDGGSTDELVRVRLLLDSTLPVIRRRTAALSAEIEQGRQLQRSADGARAALVRERQQLAERRREFAALEEQVLRLAEQRGSEALGAGDVALAMGEQATSLSQEQQRRFAARQIATELAALPPAPPRPGSASGGGVRAPLSYRLPSAAPVVEGFGSISPAGIRSRGLTLATARGARVQVPASGIVRFSGPFRSYDGIVIIDHGRGWMSLIVNVSSPLQPGAPVETGQPLGRALGRIGVELSQNGRRMSPALIAGSSQKLSNRGKYG